MNILALDDEKIALDGLMTSIEKAEPSATIYGFRKPADALEFCKEMTCDIAFLDIQLRSMSGVEVAKEIKMIHPKINIIFATGYPDYRGEAFDLHASGYVMKPITPEKVRTELDNLRHPVLPEQKNRVQIRTFGNFEVFIDRQSIKFRYERTKELLAYIVDRNGALATNGEIMAVLWQDELHKEYLRSLKKDLIDTLDSFDCLDIIEKQRGKIGILPEKVDCDYYDWLAGKAYAVNQYRGEYMSQYGWARLRYPE